MAEAYLYGQSGGGVNDTLPPLHENFTMTGGNGQVTLTFDAMPSEYSDVYKETVICLKSTEPAKPSDYTKKIVVQPDWTYTIEGA